ncbi:fusion protein [Dysgonomonas sp. 521]|uniref:fusion protein n=1 Tax=Dysgonomonas sp. 521 TaxID=2302932 RepID=UPI0013D0625C|nr:fusion protein [Dysgonomonas sp. 521]NDV94786.1 fusion protein [Dysgonomonas sp. 521]
MNKVFLLGANREINRDKQVVEVNQVIQMEGYHYDRYVVYEIRKNNWGLAYKLINLRTKEFFTTDIIRPLKEKYGIGYYYDSENPQLMDSTEVAKFLQEAKDQKQAEEYEAEQERIRTEEVRVIGRKRLAEILPDEAKAMIVGRLKQNESDSQTDYYASSVQRTVILGFSKHTRDLFSEMRKYAGNFEGTAYLSEYNEDYEHREKYSMGDGYYLGESKYSGWIIEKVSLYNRERFIEDYAYTAGQEENICIKALQTTPPAVVQQTDGLQFEIVDYSEKALALFGDTRPIKDQLKALGGRFNPKLSHNGTKRAGWIFAIAKRTELNNLLNLK